MLCLVYHIVKLLLQELLEMLYFWQYQHDEFDVADYQWMYRDFELFFKASACDVAEVIITFIEGSKFRFFWPCVNSSQIDLGHLFLQKGHKVGKIFHHHPCYTQTTDFLVNVWLQASKYLLGNLKLLPRWKPGEKRTVSELEYPAENSWLSLARYRSIPPQTVHSIEN